jgi:hypothetical protein
MWLRDKLPIDIPGVRIILYGYDTHLVNSFSFQTFHELGKSLADYTKLLPEGPLVFLAHSLGGVVLKTAIVALSSSENVAALARIWCIFLFGVPNKGMYLSHLLSMTKDFPNKALVNQLSSESTDLAEVEEAFTSIMKSQQAHIVSVYETMLSRTTKVSISVLRGVLTRC